MTKLDIFIRGEIIDLCIPTIEFAEKSKWYSWFNNSRINRFLDQGLFPNDPSLQVEYFKSQRNKRLILIISNKTDYLGVVSLSEIDWIKKKATLAIVVDSNIDLRKSPLISLEAIARISEHGFQVMGMNKIAAGQHVKLGGWQQRMELLGFRVDGIVRHGFMKGREIEDEVLIASTYDDYLKIIKKRGKYWDSAKNMMERIRKLPKEKFIDKLYDYFDNQGNKYYDEIFNL